MPKRRRRGAILRKRKRFRRVGPRRRPADFSRMPRSRRRRSRFRRKRRRRRSRRGKRSSSFRRALVLNPGVNAQVQKMQFRLCGQVPTNGWLKPGGATNFWQTLEFNCSDPTDMFNNVGKTKPQWWVELGKLYENFVVVDCRITMKMHSQVETTGDLIIGSVISTPDNGYFFDNVITPQEAMTNSRVRTRLVKHTLSAGTITEAVALIPKTYSVKQTINPRKLMKFKNQFHRDLVGKFNTNNQVTSTVDFRVGFIHNFTPAETTDRLSVQFCVTYNVLAFRPVWVGVAP